MVLPTIATPRSGLFFNKQPGGLPFISDVHKTTGNSFFVHVAGTDAAGYGKHPNSPVKTIDYAVGLCTASQGDVIYVMPGHTEAVGAADGIALDVAGIKVVGLGEGLNRPVVTLNTATGATVSVGAANITIENIVFTANFADIAICLDVNADDCTVRNCRFQATAVDMNFLVCIQAGTANQSDRLKIHYCEALAIDTENTHFVNFPAAEDECEVIGCRLIGDWGTMAVGGAGVITYCVITDNVIYNAATTVDGCINLPATATGIVMRNLAAGAAAQANGFAATACALAENYYGVLSEDNSAILDPAAT